MKKRYYEAIHQIICTGHWITDHVSRELRRFGITEPQYNVLRILKEADGEPVSVQEIQEQMVQPSSNVTRIVDKLLTKDYVERKECPANRRKMDITITGPGVKFLEKPDAQVHTFHQIMMKNLTGKELKTLKKLIIKLKGSPLPD